MRPCDDCNERLLDYVYGLLEGNELEETRDHLQSCADCQAALAQVQGEQALMARAAKAIHDVPKFTLPSETIETMPAAAVPASLPVGGSNSKSSRPFWQRPWLAWTIAASLLFVIGGSFSFYQFRLTGYQKDLTAQRNQLQDLEVAYEALPTKYELLQKREIDKLRDGASPYVHIVGPTQLQPNAKAQLRITTRNPEGELAASSGRVKVVEVPTGHIVQIKRWQSDRDGHALLELDASKAKGNGLLQVIVEAALGNGHATVKDTIRLQPPTYVTRVDTNKIAYQIDDILFFRVLVLDRYSLQPPLQPILVRVELKNPKDEIVARLDAPTSEGGILAREFPIASTFLAGTYTLSVNPRDSAQTLVQSASQKLEVVRDLRPPDIQLDQDRYAAGERVTGIVRGGALPQSALGTFGQSPPVPVTIEPEFRAPTANPGFGGGMNIAAKASKGKSAIANATSSLAATQRFSTKLPDQLPNGARYLSFKLEFQNGQQKQEYRGVVPIEPTDYDVDFFPEGGDLVAGVLNRVYYRVRSRDGEAVTGDGSLILMSGKNEFIDSRYHLGLGYLDFTPHTKESYTARITTPTPTPTPTKTTEIAQPFAKLGGIRPVGVVLHIPGAVGKQGDAIRLTLRNQGPNRKLLLAAHCRGQIVDQRWVDAKTGSQDFTLEPAQDARGMVKVTAYEIAPNAGNANALLPIAERLVYRTPVQRLELGMHLGTQNLEPGKNLQLNITARTEAGELASGWLLASVVDERFQPRSRSLSAHFLLLNEIRTGSELDDAQVVLNDAPESTAVLARFLGTHGWRRFLHRGEPARAAFAAKANDAASIVFSRESMPLEQLQKSSEAKYAAALAPLRQAAFAEESQLKTQRDHLSALVFVAEHQLQKFAADVQLAIHMSLRLLIAVLVVASLILMAVGIYRIVRQHQGATSAFGGAFACLAICFLMIPVGSLLDPLRSTLLDGRETQVAMIRQVEDKLSVQLRQDPVRRGIAEPTAPIGAFGMASPKQAIHIAAPMALSKKEQQHQAKDAAAVLREQHFARMARLDQADRASDAKPSRMNNQTYDMQSFRMRPATAPATAIDKADKPKTMQIAPLAKRSVSQPAPAANAPKDTSEEIEYAFKYSPKTFADTLLWHPRLQLVDGAVSARFDIAAGQASYRVLLLGHGPSGRFGFFETRLDVLGLGK